MQTILVTDNPKSWGFLSHLAPIVEATNYLSDECYHQNKALRVINLCQSYNYQTIGYYAVSYTHLTLPTICSV